MGRRPRGPRKHRDDKFRLDALDAQSMQNELFTKYYQAQQIVPADEWDAFMDQLRVSLPTTFRVAGSRQTAKELNETIKNTYVPFLTDIEFDGEVIPKPIQLPWYPDGLAWQFNVPKKVLRKNQEFKKFHSFLVFETEVGNISRSEAVSMLPPLFLGVEPHHRVMDMCAAPGSKTAQLLEALHTEDTVSSSFIPPGLLIANDSDYKRTHLLIHQSARLPSPALMVTNMDASSYPALKIPCTPPSTTPTGAPRLEQLLFDRILCDVPCSGDGTIRKNIGIWKSWSIVDGNGLHSLQLRILQRAMYLLKPDGRIVYSTCSLNPVENEAVVAAAINSFPEFHLVDVSDHLPNLKRRPGLTKWKATAEKTLGEMYDSYEEFKNGNTAPKAKLTEGHWPPPNVEELHLERCLRLYPHLQDTGGFFVAVLQRTETKKEKKRAAKEADLDKSTPEPKKPRVAERSPSPHPAVISTESKIEVDVAAAAAEAVSVSDPATVAEVKAEDGPESSGAGGNFKENPYTYLAPSDSSVQTCMSQLSLLSSFPTSHLLVRHAPGEATRSLYISNQIVKDVIESNHYGRIRLTAAGTRIITKQDAGRGMDARFRVLGEGLPLVLPYIDPATIIEVTGAVMKVVVEKYYPLCDEFAEPFKSIISAKGPGCHIICAKAVSTEDTTISHDLYLPIWKSNVSITLMIDKRAKSALSLRLFGKDISQVGKERDDAATAKKSSVKADTVTTGGDSDMLMEPAQEEEDD